MVSEVPPVDLPLGIRLAVDPGRVRVGVARSDPQGLMAVPVTTLTIANRDGHASDRARLQTAQAIVDLAHEFEACYIVVGYPVDLRGSIGPAAMAAEQFAVDVASGSPCPVYLLDERLTTRQASRELQQVGRDSRASRRVIDQAAAVLLLEQALALERANGTPPGCRVTVEGDRRGGAGP